MTPQEREREARRALVEKIYRRLVQYEPDLEDMGLGPYINELIASVEARVRWEQQADAEGYTEGRP